MAWYRTGTVTVANGSTTVTGAGTAFVANVSIGEGFLGPDGNVYEIAGVVSNTQLTLAAAYQGAGASAQNYAILPTQSALADLATQAAQLVNSFAAVRDGVGQGLFADGSAASPGLRFANDQDTGIYRYGTDSFGFATGGSQRLRFDTSNLLATINMLPTSSNAYSIGNASFRWSAIWASTIATPSGVNLTFQAGSQAWNVSQLSGAMYPQVDNTQPVGGGSNRVSVVYAGTGTINTSDERAKTWRGDLTAGEFQAGLAVIDELGFYQFNESIAEKGPDGARYHFGLRAQQVWAAFAAQGLVDAIDGTGRPGETPYGFLCFDEWEEETAPVLDAEGQPTGATTIVREAGFRYGIRPDELALFLIAVQAKRQAELEVEVGSQAAAIMALQSSVSDLEAAA